MKLKLKIIVFPIFLIALMFGLTYTAFAAGTFRTTDDVRFRTGPSTDAKVIWVISNYTNVEVLEHDPAGWSKVTISNTTGYIRSDFLKFPIGNTPATFYTTDGVNLRSSPSNKTNDNKLQTVVTGTAVEVLEHDPAGWSKVRSNGTTGYIRSDFLTRTENFKPAVLSAQSPKYLLTNDGVYFRRGPSTDAARIKLLPAGTRVEVLDQESNGWSKVRLNGEVGYIRSDFLSLNGTKVELIHWSVVKELLSNGMVVRVRDIQTGKSFNVQILSRGKHADVEAATQADSDIIRNEVYDGSWSWTRRPVVVMIGDKVVAASMNGMPHGRGPIQGNGMNGHICIHFLGSENHNGSVSSAKIHQANVQTAYNSG